MFLLFLYGTVSILFSFLCSILEAVLLSITPSFISMKKAEGKAYVESLEELKKDVDKPLIAILTLNTIAHTVGAILVGVQAEKLPYEFDFLGINIVGLVSGIMTYLILVVSEIIPKTIGATHWKSLANFATTTLNILLFPLKWTGILWFLQLHTKLIGNSAHVTAMSRDEFIAMADTAQEEGVIKGSETTVIKNLLAFKLIEAKDVMTPFTVAVIEDEETSLIEFHEGHKNLKFSRIPVYKDKTHNITGFVMKDDILEQLVEKNGNISLAEIKRDILIVNALKPIPELFDKLIKNKAHIAIVVDEFGNMIGLITMEDIIETLLGLEIMDESDNIEDMQVLARKNWERRAKRLGIIPQEGTAKNTRQEPQKDSQLTTSDTSDEDL